MLPSDFFRRTPDGRTGAVAASCVFWIEATEAVFATVAEDHGNCSVGSLTHGFKTMARIAAMPMLPRCAKAAG